MHIEGSWYATTGPAERMSFGRIEIRAHGSVGLAEYYTLRETVARRLVHNNDIN